VQRNIIAGVEGEVGAVLLSPDARNCTRGWQVYQTGFTIKNVSDMIASNQYVLPTIQREFVWRPEQVCSLSDSVMQGYPLGDFLFWRIAPERSEAYCYYGFVCEYHHMKKKPRH